MKIQYWRNNIMTTNSYKIIVYHIFSFIKLFNFISR